MYGTMIYHQRERAEARNLTRNRRRR
ncbi:hypothetical protein P9292_42505 [Caballeronia sp. LZ001]|nr:hypothetical protein [Caballeronia sp. LZ001]